MTDSNSIESIESTYDIKQYVESCKSASECEKSWTKINESMIEEHKLDDTYMNIPVQCIKTDDNCDIINKKTGEILDSTDNKYLDDSLSGKTDDLKYCPTFRKLKYKEYEQTSYMTYDTGLTKRSGLDDNGCANNKTVYEAKDYCDTQKDCDGFFTHDKSKRSRVCYKTNQYIFNPISHSEQTSAFYLKEKYKKYLNTVGFGNNSIRSSNLVDGFENNASLNKYGCTTDSTLQFDKVQEMCNKNILCDGFTMSKPNISRHEACFIKNINTSLTNISNDSRDLYVKTDKWKSQLKNISDDSDINFQICSNDCKLDDKGQIMNNQQGCTYKSEDGVKYINMGFPLKGTDWCPSNLTTNDNNFTIPTYSLSTSIKNTTNSIGTIGYNPSNTGIKKCAKLCKKHNDELSSDSPNWECTGFSYKPTETVPIYDFSNQITKKTSGKITDYDKYICNLGLVLDGVDLDYSFNSPHQTAINTTIVSDCSDVVSKGKTQKCTKSKLGWCSDDSGESNDYSPKTSELQDRCESQYIQYKNGVYTPCKFYRDTELTHGGNFSNAECKPSTNDIAVCLSNKYLDKNSKYFIDGEECQLHGAFLEPYEKIEKLVNEIELKKIDGVNIITHDTSKTVEKPENSLNTSLDWNATGCVDHVSLSDASNYCMNSSMCDAFYTTDHNYIGKTCFLNITDEAKSKLDETDSKLFDSPSTIDKTEQVDGFNLYKYTIDFNDSSNQNSTEAYDLDAICKTDKQIDIIKNCSGLFNAINASDINIENIRNESNNCINSQNASQLAMDILMCLDNDDNCSDLKGSIIESYKNIKNLLKNCSENYYLGESVGVGCYTLNSASAGYACLLDDKCSGFFTYNTSKTDISKTCFKTVSSTNRPNMLDNKNEYFNKSGFFVKTELDNHLFNPVFYKKNSNITLNNSNIYDGINLDTNEGYYKYLFPNTSANINADININKLLDSSDKYISYDIYHPPDKISSDNKLGVLNTNFNFYNELANKDLTPHQDKSCLTRYDTFNDLVKGKTSRFTDRKDKKLCPDYGNNISNITKDGNKLLPENKCLYAYEDGEILSSYEINPFVCDNKFYSFNASDVDAYNNSSYTLSSTGWAKCRWNPKTININGTELNGYCDFLDNSYSSSYTNKYKVNECIKKDYNDLDTNYFDKNNIKDKCGTKNVGTTLLKSFSECDNLTQEQCGNSFYSYNNIYYPCEVNSGKCKGTHSTIGECVLGDENYCCYNSNSLNSEKSICKVNSKNVSEWTDNSDECDCPTNTTKISRISSSDGIRVYRCEPSLIDSSTSRQPLPDPPKPTPNNSSLPTCEMNPDGLYSIWRLDKDSCICPNNGETVSVISNSGEFNGSRVYRCQPPSASPTPAKAPAKAPKAPAKAPAKAPKAPAKAPAPNNSNDKSYELSTTQIVLIILAILAAIGVFVYFMTKNKIST